MFLTQRQAAIAAGCLALAASARADIITLQAAADNTIYSEAEGVSNGAGQYIFAGRTNLGGIRRTLLRFDLAVPQLANVTINAVTLRLHLSRAANTTSSTMRLSRVVRSWGEGTSDAGQNEGAGADSAPGDATWFNRFWTQDLPWTTPGGDLTGVSGSASVADVGFYTWSGAGLIADAQSWLSSPASNFGWALLGQETSNRTTKRFDSRENPDPTFRPSLTIDYTRVPAPGSAGALALAGLLALRRRR